MGFLVPDTHPDVLPCFVTCLMKSPARNTPSLTPPPSFTGEGLRPGAAGMTAAMTAAPLAPAPAIAVANSNGMRG